MIEIALLGTGNVASHLFRAFSKSPDISVKQVFNHSAESLKPFTELVPTTTSIEGLVEADVYLLVLKDDVIPTYAEKLKHRKGLIAHTSGAVSLEAIKGPGRTGVFYPLQTFSKELKLDYSEIPFCIEAEQPEDLNLLKTIGNSISSKVFEINSLQRKQLHLSAVFVCNFVNHLYTVGQDICEQHQIPFEILEPLIKATAEKVKQASPRTVQTGPAIRGDQGTIEAHLELLTSMEHKKIYQLLTTAIQSEHGKKL